MASLYTIVRAGLDVTRSLIDTAPVSGARADGRAVALPPVAGRFSYQIGGAYPAPDSGSTHRCISSLPSATPSSACLRTRGTTWAVVVPRWVRSATTDAGQIIKGGLRSARREMKLTASRSLIGMAKRSGSP
jgi:hypothetical protein